MAAHRTARVLHWVLLADLCTSAALSAANSTVTLIGPGQGTTATRLLHQTICSQGLKCCHWDACCNLGEDEESIRTRDAHYGLLTAYRVLALCVANDQETLEKDCNLARDLSTLKPNASLGPPPDCPRRLPLRSSEREDLNHFVARVGCHAEPFLKEVRERVLQFLSSGIEAAVDAPIPALLSFIAALAPPQAFRMAMTTRDPAEWAIRRIAVHGDNNMMCRRNVLGARLGDFAGCLMREVDESEGETVLLSDVFVPLGSVLPEDLEKEMRAYQDVFVPKIARRLGSGDSADTAASALRRWLFEFDAFSGSINRYGLQQTWK